MGAAEVPQRRRRTDGRTGVARVWPAAVAVWLACGGIASAQQAISTGTITGIVQDEQGLPIPGALVEVTNTRTQGRQSTVSNATGIFNVPALVIGPYKVSVSLPGFSTVERVDIQLQSNETHNAGIVTLRAGISETLTVTADPIGVQTSTAVRTSVLDTSTIDTMVSRGRDPVRLLNSLPGVDPEHRRPDHRRHHRHQPANHAGHGRVRQLHRDRRRGLFRRRYGQQQRHHQHGRHPGDPGGDEQLHRGVRTQHRAADQRRHQVGRAEVLRQPLDLHPSRGTQFQYPRERASRAAETDCAVLHRRRNDRRTGGPARHREAQADLLLLHAGDVGHEAAVEPQHEADADHRRNAPAISLRRRRPTARPSSSGTPC